MKKLILRALLVMILSVAGCGLRVVVQEDYRTKDTIVVVDPPVVDYRYRYGPRGCWRHHGCYGSYHGYHYVLGPYPY